MSMALIVVVPVLALVILVLLFRMGRKEEQPQGRVTEEEEPIHREA